jgi:hypothetical protein
MPVAAPTADVLRSVTPPARTAFILEVMLREIYLGLLNSFYHVSLPLLFPHATSKEKALMAQAV